MDCNSEAASHYAGCSCNEERWRAKLEAAKVRAASLSQELLAARDGRDTNRARAEAAEARVAELEAALRSADSILWMAREYAEAGGSHGPEMCDFSEAEATIRDAIHGHSEALREAKPPALTDAIDEVRAALDQHRRFPGPDATRLMCHALETVLRARAALAGEEGK